MDKNINNMAKVIKFKGIDYDSKCLIDFDGNEVAFDKTNLLHVMYAKMFILQDAYLRYRYVIKGLERGCNVLTDFCTDVDDMDNMETYWLDGYFSQDELGVNAAKHDQLSMQLDKDGNWH